MRMFRQTHRRALWKPVIHDLLCLPETQESYCQSCYDMHLNVYRWIYIYIQYIYIYYLFTKAYWFTPCVFSKEIYLYSQTASENVQFVRQFVRGGPATHQPGPENEWSGTEPLKPWVDVKQVNDRPPKLYTLPETNSNISPEKWWVGLLLCNFLLKCSLLGGHNR